MYGFANILALLLAKTIPQFARNNFGASPRRSPECKKLRYTTLQSLLPARK
jgi:hypothetical protein